MRELIAAIALLVAPAVGAQERLEADWDEGWEESESRGLQWHGFLEAALGGRFDDDPLLDDRITLGDARLRLETDWAGDVLAVSFKGEALYDAVSDELEGAIRDLTLSFSPAASLDMKAGRQVLTWGTGDLLFLNDLFPKDWVSFFSGRDDEYLKAPSNALRASYYGGRLNVDLAWLPQFEPDDYLTGERFSFFSPAAGMQVAPDPPLGAREPGAGELALRLFRSIAGTEYAAYVFHGYFKQPTALDEAGEPAFAPLTAVGASLRRPLYSGLANAEVAYYVSRDDRAGTDPRVPNDQLRLLAGYERELATSFRAGFQYYLEWTQDHGALIARSPMPELEPDRLRHVITTRLSYSTRRDQLLWSLFSFYSPSDDDYYLRPQIAYRYSDQWALAGGVNLFGGAREHTFFAQLEDSSNAYFRIRFSY